MNVPAIQRETWFCFGKKEKKGTKQDKRVGRVGGGVHFSKSTRATQAARSQCFEAIQVFFFFFYPSVFFKLVPKTTGGCFFFFNISLFSKEPRCCWAICYRNSASSAAGALAFVSYSG